MDDASDIETWVTHRDEAAFGRIVERHSGLVAAACRRELGAGSEADAAIQAVFIILSRRIGGIRDRGRIGPWLFGVAVRVCRQARRSATRRKRHEQEASMHPNRSTATDAPWDELRPRLNEALLSLSEAQRTVVIGHCLEGRPQAVVAAQLGISEEAVKKRFHYALDKLRSWFANRGLAVGAVALGAGLASEACAAEPATTTACVQAALHPTGGTVATALAEATFKTGVGTSMVAISAALAALVCAGVLLGRGADPAPPPAAVAAEAPPQPPPPAPATGPPAYYLVQDYLDHAGISGSINGMTGEFTPAPVDPKAQPPYLGLCSEHLYGPAGRRISKTYKDGVLTAIDGCDGTEDWCYDPQFDIILIQRPKPEFIRFDNELVDARATLAEMAKVYQQGSTTAGKDPGTSIVRFGDFKPEIMAKNNEQKPGVAHHFGRLVQGFELVVDTQRNLVLSNTTQRLAGEQRRLRLSVPAQDPAPTAFAHLAFTGPRTLVLPDPGAVHLSLRAENLVDSAIYLCQQHCPINLAYEQGLDEVRLSFPILPGWAEETQRRLIAPFPRNGVDCVRNGNVVLFFKQDGQALAAWNEAGRMPNLPAACYRDIPRLACAKKQFTDDNVLVMPVMPISDYFILSCINREEKKVLRDALLELSTAAGIPITCDAALEGKPIDLQLYHPLTVQAALRVIATLTGARVTTDGKTVTLVPLKAESRF